MPETRAAILVTDGEQRAALATVRSLGRAGYIVHVCSAAAPSIAGASRFAATETRVADPLGSPGEYFDDLKRLMDVHGIHAVLPISEASLLALLPRRHELTAVIPFPELDVFERICDKAAVLRSAAAVGIEVPKQVRIERREDADFDTLDVRFPLVVKPIRSVSGDAGGRAKSSVRHVATLEALHASLRALEPRQYPVLLQERVVGPGIGVFVLMWEGVVRASFFHRRIREKPPSGGVSVLRESVAPDHALLERSVALLRSLGWVNGVAMVEYKVDAASGSPYIMEINGRFWGSLQLAIDAGVDFPALLVAAALGRPTEAVNDYRIGVSSRWFMGDVDHLLTRLRRSRAALGLTPEEPGRRRVILDFLAAFRPGIRAEILKLGDPAPALRETIEWLKGR